MHYIQNILTMLFFDVDNEMAARKQSLSEVSAEGS